MVTLKMVDAAVAALKRHKPGVTDWHVAVGSALEHAAAAAWVPCAERMPEEGVEVLVYVAALPDWNWEAFEAIAHWDGDAEWWLDQRRASVPRGEVTHWMPLPAPPKD